MGARPVILGKIRKRNPRCLRKGDPLFDEAKAAFIGSKIAGEHKAKVAVRLGPNNPALAESPLNCVGKPGGKGEL